MSTQYTCFFFFSYGKGKSWKIELIPLASNNAIDIRVISIGKLQESALKYD